MTRPATRRHDQITIRIDPEVGRRLRIAAAERRVSVSRVIDEALRIAVGVGTEVRRPDPLPRIGDRLDWLAGTMSEHEARRVLDAVSAHETIDEEFWARTPRRRKRRA